MPISTEQEWKSFVDSCPDAHILQTSAWGILKSRFGWETSWLISGNIGAQILFQPIRLGYHIGYIPKGPISPDGSQYGEELWYSFQREVDDLCRSRQAVFMKIEPDIWETQSNKESGFHSGYRKGKHSIQPPRTIVVSLEGSDDDILARMKSKTRYNIRLAIKKDVTVRQIDDIQPFYSLLESTADRSEFGIHTREYYQTAFDLFSNSGACKLFLAEFQHQPLASIMVFIQGNRCWYFYGASSDDHRDRMPTYLVQWEAMRWAKQQGCLSYDFWGVPDHDQDVLESQFLERRDGLWGVYRFKRGFGGEIKRSTGPWDRVFHPMLYAAYSMYFNIQE